MDATTETIKKETIDDLLNSAHEHGEFGLIKLDNVSYYASERAKRKIVPRLYFVELEKFHVGIERYRELEKRAGIHPPTPAGSFLQHVDVDGSFLIYRQENSYYGILDLRRIKHHTFPEINLSLIPENSLYPNKHQILRFSAGNPSHVYTVDEDGSEWSLHGLLKNNFIL